MKGFFLSILPQSKQSDRPSIQSSELGPPTPSTARVCCFPPVWIQLWGWGTNSLPDDWVGGTNSFRRWDIHSGTLSIHVHNYNPSRPRLWNIQQCPWPPPLTSQLRWSFWRTIKRKKRQKNQSVGAVAYPGGMHRMHVHPPSPPVCIPPLAMCIPPSPAWKAGYEKRWGSGQQEKNASLFTCDLKIFCRVSFYCIQKTVF